MILNMILENQYILYYLRGQEEKKQRYFIFVSLYFICVYMHTHKYLYIKKKLKKELLVTITVFFIFVTGHMVMAVIYIPSSRTHSVCLLHSAST